jgi:hypothetical protein
MAGQYGIDIWIKARDTVKQGADQAARSLRSSLAGIGRDVGAGAMGGFDRNMFRGLTRGLVDAADEGLNAAAEAIRDWNAGVDAAEGIGARIGTAMLESVTGALRNIPIAGALGELAARGIFDPLTGGYMAREDQMMAAQAKSAQLGELQAKSREAGDSLKSFLRDQQVANSEELKWIKLQEQGAAAVTAKYRPLIEGAQLMGGDSSSIRAERDAELDHVRRVIIGRRQLEDLEKEREQHKKWWDEGEKKRQQEAEKAARDAEREAERVARERAKNVEEASSASGALQRFMRENDAREAAERQWQDLLEEGIELVNEKYATMAKAAEADEAALKRIEGARAAEIGQVRALVQAKRAAADQEDLEEKRRKLEQAEGRLAEASTSRAVLALRFRSQAEQRAQRQAADAAAAKPIPADPAILKEMNRQTRQLEALRTSMEQLALRMPQITVGAS